MHGTGLLCSNQGFEMQSLVLKLQHLHWNQGHAQHLPTKNSNIVLLCGIKKKTKSFTEAKYETNLLSFLIPKIISFVTWFY